MRTLLRRSFFLLAPMLALLQLGPADEPAGGTFRNLHIQGDVMAQGGELLVKSNSATVVVGEGGYPKVRR